MNWELLERRVLAALRSGIGRRLSGVEYWCLHGEALQGDIEADDFYMGGELRLTFDGLTLFISWDENAGWSQHFSVAVSTSSLFVSDARLERFDGSFHPLWRPLIGERLRAAEVWGSDGVPYAVILRFQGGSVVAASSYQTRIGDGDDLVVGAEALLEDEVPLEVLWLSGKSEDHPN